jgi:hypothetical protein
MILLTLPIVLACASSVTAGPIYVFDGVAGGGDSFAVLDLKGERGFRLIDGIFGLTASRFPSDGLIQCGQRVGGVAPNFDHRCRPGQQISLSQITIPTPDFVSRATLDGKQYKLGGFFNGTDFDLPIACDSAGPIDPLRCGPPNASLQADFIAPSRIVPPLSGVNCDLFDCTVTLKAPFRFTGSLTYLNSSGQLVTDSLIGSGQATFSLRRSNQPLGDQPDDFWRFAGQSFDIQPTPEPATLLFVGTGVAGVGIARWIRRKKQKERGWRRVRPAP